MVMTPFSIWINRTTNGCLLSNHVLKKKTATHTVYILQTQYTAVCVQPAPVFTRSLGLPAFKAQIWRIITFLKFRTHTHKHLHSHSVRHCHAHADICRKYLDARQKTCCIKPSLYHNVTFLISAPVHLAQRCRTNGV